MIKSGLNTSPNAKYNRIFWRLFFSGFALFTLMLIAAGAGLFGKLPSFRDLENPKSNLASEIISADNVVLGTYYIQNRSSVRFKDISPNAINALIATEDSRFFRHSGIDFKRLVTIFFYNIIGRKQGGSTISQQLALNLFSERARNPFKRIIQKMQEWFVAIKLERYYTKEEILTMYFNTVDFGHNSFGIKAAARTYFNTSPNKLTIEQAAMLVGLLKGSSIYSPIRHPERCFARRNVVLSRMFAEGYISEAEYESTRMLPLAILYQANTHNDGLAAYLRASMKAEIRKIFENQNITKADGTPYDLDRDGLKIYTTIDSRMQLYAEEAQKEYMKDLQSLFFSHWKGKNPFNGFEVLIEQAVKQSDHYKQLQEMGKTDIEIDAEMHKPIHMDVFTWAGKRDTIMSPLDSIRYYKMILRNALMSIDPQSGYIKAWVGGNNFEFFKYDQVRTGARQVGSTAKPFTYAVAIDNGFEPCQRIPNVPVTIDDWTPSAYDPIEGNLTLREALSHSQNYIAAYLMQQVGPQSVVDLIKKMGITSDVPPYPSICLGTFDASLYDMVGAYSVFVNQGIWTEPTYLLRIEDKNGSLLYTRTPRIVLAMNPQTAYLMTYMMKGVIEQGTGRRLRYRYGFSNPIAGKTGTTQNNSDGWFIGMTPQLVTGVWSGCEDRAIHFRSTHLGEGSNVALPIWAGYMKRVYSDTKLGITKKDFNAPKDSIYVQMNCGGSSNPVQKAKNIDKKTKTL